MKLNDKHLEALKSIGFDLAADKGVLTEYFNKQKTDSYHFLTKEDGTVVCRKSKDEVVNAILNVAFKNGVNHASYEVCVLLEKVAAKRKEELAVSLDAQIAAQEAELARLKALRDKAA